MELRWEVELKEEEGGALDDRAGQFFLFRLATQLIVRVHNKADPIGCTWAARG